MSLEADTRPGCLLSGDDERKALRMTLAWVAICGEGSLHDAVQSEYRHVEFDGTPIGEWVKKLPRRRMRGGRLRRCRFRSASPRAS